MVGGSDTGRIAVAVLVAVGVAVALAALAVRDTPARPALGERLAASSADVTIEYYANGPRGGSPVVLVPSFARSAADFNELVRALSLAGHRTLAVQPRGVQGSTLPSYAPTYHTYAADVLAVLDAEGLRQPAHVLGHAYGNRVARAFATNYPDRTRSIVLLAAGGVAPPPPEVGAAVGRAVMGMLPESVRRDAIATAFFASGNEVSLDWMKGWYPRAGLAEMRAAQATPYSEWGHGGAAPILVLQPSEDAAAEDGGRLLKEAFPERVELIEVTGAGHALLPERPGAVSSEVLRFFRTHE